MATREQVKPETLLNIRDDVVLGTFESELVAAYEGETLGHAYFQAMAAYCRDDIYAKRAFSILAEVEKATEQLMAALLDKRGLPHSKSGAAEALGLAVAASFSSLDWPELLAAMEKRITSACHRYDALSSIASPEDAEALELLQQHEWALAAFVRPDLSRKNEAVRPSLRYLRRVKGRTCLKVQPS